MNTMNIVTTAGRIDVLWNEDEVSSVTMWFGNESRTLNSSFLENGKIVFSPRNAPEGCVYPLTQKEVDGYVLSGGQLYMFADDIYPVTFMPLWWGVECEMAIENECPAWPLAEEDIAGEDVGLGFKMATAILYHLNNQENENWDDDNDNSNNDDDEDDDDGFDFV